jgi:hypothetical protein
MSQDCTPHRVLAAVFAVPGLAAFLDRAGGDDRTSITSNTFGRRRLLVSTWKESTASSLGA